MANLDAPFGFRPVGELGSEVNTGGTSKYLIASGSSNAIYKGDVVYIIGTGYIDVSGATTTANIGVFNGCFYNDPTTQKPTWKNYYPGSITPTVGNIEAFVYDDPNRLFEVQSAGTLTQAAVGDNADQVYTAGSTINGASKSELAGSATGSSAQFRIIRISEDPSNSDIASANANWIVRFNEHVYYANTAGV
tara:strand:+ start:14 stop:589 length:576 start_codon:yes stop_codon:yes gene_type:complete